jgi:hypothetical protein
MAKKALKRRPWTKDDVRTLKSLAREKTKTTVIARKLKRSLGATHQQASKLGVMLSGLRKKRAWIDSLYWRVQVVPEDESASENCLHCEINDVVQEHIERQEKVDIVDLAARMAESLVELILLAPEEEQGKLLAATIAHLGHVFLEKSGSIEGDSNMTHWRFREVEGVGFAN